MTDEEKIRHLIKCANSETIALVVWRNPEEKCEKITLGDVAAIIIRQQAEIERSNRSIVIIEQTVEDQSRTIKSQTDLINKLYCNIETARAEAIKEFIEKCVMEFGCGRGDDRAECYISDADFLEVMERMYVGGEDK